MPSSIFPSNELACIICKFLIYDTLFGPHISIETFSFLWFTIHCISVLVVYLDGTSNNDYSYTAMSAIWSLKWFDWTICNDFANEDIYIYIGLHVFNFFLNGLFLQQHTAVLHKAPGLRTLKHGEHHLHIKHYSSTLATVKIKSCLLSTYPLFFYMFVLARCFWWLLNYPQPRMGCLEVTYVRPV